MLNCKIDINYLWCVCFREWVRYELLCVRKLIYLFIEVYKEYNIWKFIFILVMFIVFLYNKKGLNVNMFEIFLYNILFENSKIIVSYLFF